MEYKGTPKSVTAEFLASNVQVYDVEKKKIGKLGNHLPNTNQWPVHYLDGSPSDFLSGDPKDRSLIKTFVMEWDSLSPVQRKSVGEENKNKFYKNLPIHPNHWQKCIDENILDNGSEIKFNIDFGTVFNGGAKKSIQVAKIIETGQKLYTIGQMKDAFNAGRTDKDLTWENYTDRL